VRRDRFSSEALLLGLLLLSWVAGLLFVQSPTGLLIFSVRPGTDLTTEARGPVRRDNGRLVIRGSHARLASFELEPPSSYLVIVRAPAGGRFTLQLVDSDSRAPVTTRRIPPRTRQRDFLLLLDPEDLPHRVRLDLRQRSPAELVLERVELRRLSGSYRWVSRAIAVLGPMLLVLFGLRHRQALIEYFGPRRGDRSRNTRGWDRVFALVVLLACFLSYWAAPVQQLIDAKFITVVSHSLLDSGTLSLPPDFRPAQKAGKIYQLQKIGDKTYHFFADAPAILNAPFVALFRLGGITPLTADGEFDRQSEQRILRFTAAFLAALLCAVLFRLARFWLEPGWALGLTAAFAFGTQIFSTLSRSYWSHSWAVLLLATALSLLLSPRVNDKTWSYVASASLLCWAYFCRPTMSLSIIGITVLLFLTKRRFLPYFLATGLAWAALLATYSLRVFGTPLPPYLLSSHLSSGRLSGGILMTSYPEALLGTLISPGRGLFVYVPLYALILVIVIRHWHSIPDKSLAVTGLAICAAHWQVVSLFRNWWGGQCFGPRLMSDIVPWFFVLAALAVSSWHSTTREGPARWRVLRLAAVALVVAASIFVNTRGAIAKETVQGAGIWNWRHPQFLDGLIPEP
jgi:hypothetical protein